MLVAIGLWKEGNKKNNLFWMCLWSHGALKFQITFWALRPTSIKKFKIKIKLIQF
jgi:hypothetical protein